MIDLHQYEPGKEYEYAVTTYSPRPLEASNEQVRQLLLKALYNVYRVQPTRAKFEHIDVEGFCQLVGISKSSYEFNASVLKDKGYIDESPIQQLNISNGGVYISPSGIDVVETSVQTHTTDTSLGAKKDLPASDMSTNSHRLLSKEAIKLLSVMSEVALRDEVYSLFCIEIPSPRQVSRWDYQIQGATEHEPLVAEDITGGAMDELCEANFVRRTRKNAYLLLQGGLEWLQSERNKQLRKQILEAVAELQKEKWESYYIEDTAIASKLALELEDTQDYLEIISGEGYLEITHTFGGSQVALSSLGRMALKNPQFISTSHQGISLTKPRPNTTEFEPLQQPDKHIRILFLTANPSDTGWIRLDNESRAIDQALRQAKFRDEFDIKQHRAVRVTDLQELLLRHEPHIVHFSGHGSDKGEIVLEDDFGNSHYVTTEALAKTFFLLKDNIRCVVLNACYSESQAQAIAQHIDCVIGMSEAIGDKQSISFSTAFYRALAYGKDIQTAFNLGCNEINIQNLGGEGVPKLIAIRANLSEIVLTKGR